MRISFSVNRWRHKTIRDVTHFLLLLWILVRMTMELWIKTAFWRILFLFFHRAITLLDVWVILFRNKRKFNSLVTVEFFSCIFKYSFLSTYTILLFFQKCWKFLFDLIKGLGRFPFDLLAVPGLDTLLSKFVCVWNEVILKTS